MTTRGARRRRRSAVSRTPLERFQRFIRSWEAIIGISLLIVLIVLIAGIFRWSISLPFGIGAKPAPPDIWGSITIPAGANPKVLYVADVSKGQPVDAAGTRQAVELALKERGTVQGRQVELTVAEDGCDPGQAESMAAEQAQDPLLVGVISQACPASAAAAKRAFEEARLPYMVLANTAPSFTGPGTLVTFRMRWNEKSQGREAARIVRQEIKAGRALVLYESAGEHQAVAAEFRLGFRAQGGTVVDLRPVAPGAAEAAGVAAQARDMNADFVYYAGGGRTGLAVLHALRGGPYSGVWMVSDTAYRDPEYAATGATLEGTYASNLQTDRGDRFNLWKEGYEKEYGPVGDLSAEAYDAATVLLRGLEVVAQKKDSQLEIGRQRTVSMLRSLPYEGVSGRLGFDANGDRTVLSRPVLKYEGGTWQEVKITTPAPVLAPTVPPEPQAEEAGEEPMEEPTP